MNAGVVLGVLNGLLIGLLAVGLVLVYKSSRFINLAHAQLGALSAFLMAKFVLDWGLSWWVAFPIAVTIGATTGLAVERGFIRKLRAKTASPVSLLLLSIGIAQLLLALTYVSALGPDVNILSSRGYPLPFTSHVKVAGVILGGQYVLVIILVPALVAVLAGFLRYSTMGKMIRAAATSPDSARLCGIPVGRVSAVTWGIAGGLSAVTAILQAPSEASFNAAALGPDLLLRALGAAAVGGLVSIPAALIGGLGVGLAEQLTLSVTHNSATAELVTFIIILLILLARGKTIATAFKGEGAAAGDRSPTRTPMAVRSRALVRYRRLWLGMGSAAVALMFPLLPYFRPEGRRFELALVLVYALVGVSVTMLIGWAGQVSLGQFALVGVGAFLTARLAPHGWTLSALLLVSGVIGAIIMVVVGLPAVRLRGLTLTVTTLGLAVVAPAWLFRQRWFVAVHPSGADVPPPGIAPGLGHPASLLWVYYAALAVLSLVLAGAGALRRSVPGRLILAVRDNESATASFGFTPATVKLAVLALSGFVAAMAGVLWADSWRTVSTNQFDPALSLSILAIPVIGGLGSLGGAVAAAVVIYLPAFFIAPLLTGIFGQYGRQIGFQLALGGLGLVGVLLAYPSGIAGAAQRAWEVFLTRLATKFPVAPDSGPPVPLVVEGVTVSFGGVRALRGASVTVGSGEIVGLIGPNGAGKSTLMDVISGSRRPSEGSVRLFGEEVVDLSAEYRASFGLARSFQDAHLFPGLTVIETVQLALSRTTRVGVFAAFLGAPWARSVEREGRGRAEDILERFGLSSWADSLTAELSTGTRRICDLAAQVAASPRVLLLDEPTAGVAQREAEALGTLLRRIRDELDCSILIVEHSMPLLMGLCDRVYAMEAGTIIAEGTPAEIRVDPAVIAGYLGRQPPAPDPTTAWPPVATNRQDRPRTKGGVR